MAHTIKIISAMRFLYVDKNIVRIVLIFIILILIFIHFITYMIHDHSKHIYDL